MKCLKPITLKSGLQVNCGYCRSCRVNYTSQWKLRLMYELDNWDCASFVTLTFDDQHLIMKDKPMELDKKDLQNFFKRLRKDLDGRKIKYYACGEYGEKKSRPHYHAIIFGLDPYNDNDRKLISDNWQLCESWQFDRSRGFRSAILPVSPESIAYVTGYVQKKLNGEMADKAYGSAQRPFSICSQGMGLDFALKHKERLFANGFTYINGGKKIGLPKYYRDKLGINLLERMNDDTPVSSLRDRLLSENKELFELFKKDYPEHCNDLDFVANFFPKWYENYRWSYADRIFADFQQRQKLRGSKI